MLTLIKVGDRWNVVAVDPTGRALAFFSLRDYEMNAVADHFRDHHSNGGMPGIRHGCLICAEQRRRGFIFVGADGSGGEAISDAQRAHLSGKEPVAV